jgi:hypothetical protein
MDELASKYATSNGFLTGYIMGQMLYDNNITSSRFKSMYEAIVRSHEITNTPISEFDMTRIKKRAEEIGATI